MEATRTNPQQHVKTAELLLAHRQHRHHGAPPGTPEPGEVSPLYCRGVSSLYCAYNVSAHNIVFWKVSRVSAGPQRFLRSGLRFPPPPAKPTHARKTSTPNAVS